MVQRVLLVKAGVIRNIIGYPDVDELGNPVVFPESDTDGEYVLAVTGTESVGDAFDLTDTRLERRLAKFDIMIYRELFRLTNEVRVLRGLGTITANQYRNAIKAQA